MTTVPQRFIIAHFAMLNCKFLLTLALILKELIEIGRPQQGTALTSPILGARSDFPSPITAYSVQSVLAVNINILHGMSGTCTEVQGIVQEDESRAHEDYALPFNGDPLISTDNVADTVFSFFSSFGDKSTELNKSKYQLYISIESLSENSRALLKHECYQKLSNGEISALYDYTAQLTEEECFCTDRFRSDFPPRYSFV